MRLLALVLVAVLVVAGPARADAINEAAIDRRIQAAQAHMTTLQFQEFMQDLAGAYVGQQVTRYGLVSDVSPDGRIWVNLEAHARCEGPYAAVLSQARQLRRGDRLRLRVVLLGVDAVTGVEYRILEWAKAPPAARTEPHKPDLQAELARRLRESQEADERRARGR